MFNGSITALITPFKDGEVVKKVPILRRLEITGSHGVVPVGTTGESPTLSHDEHKRVVELCIDVAKGRVPVIAGAGSNSTEEAVDFTKHAKEAGADGVLHVCPYYNKPTQEGLYLHFKAVAECADIPVIIYNIPGRSVVDMSVETMTKLSKLKNIAGVKDATCDWRGRSIAGLRAKMVLSNCPARTRRSAPSSDKAVTAAFGIFECRAKAVFGNA